MQYKRGLKQEKQASWQLVFTFVVYKLHFIFVDAVPFDTLAP